MKFGEDNEQVVLAHVRIYGKDLKRASKRLRDNKKIVMAAISQNGFAVQHASKRLLDDKEVIMASIRNGGVSSAFIMASDRLKMDQDIVLTVVSKYPGLIEFAPEEMRDNIYVMYKASIVCEKRFSHEEHIIECASPRIKSILKEMDPDSEYPVSSVLYKAMNSRGKSARNVTSTNS